MRVRERLKTKIFFLVNIYFAFYQFKPKSSLKLIKNYMFSTGEQFSLTSWGGGMIVLVSRKQVDRFQSMGRLSMQSTGRAVCMYVSTGQLRGTAVNRVVHSTRTVHSNHSPHEVSVSVSDRQAASVSGSVSRTPPPCLTLPSRVTAAQTRPTTCPLN